MNDGYIYLVIEDGTGYIHSAWLDGLLAEKVVEEDKTNTLYLSFIKISKGTPADIKTIY